MVMDVNLGIRPSSETTNAENFNSTHTVASALYSLFDKIDSESIVVQFEVGRHYIHSSLALWTVAVR